MKCIYCNSEVELTSSDIITSAITGAKLRKSFVCKTHNAFTNEHYESKFVASLDYFRSQLGLTTREKEPIKYKADLSIGGKNINNVTISGRESIFAPKVPIIGRDDDGNKTMLYYKERLNNIHKGEVPVVDMSKITLRKTVAADSFIGNVIKLSFSAQKGYSYWKFVTQKCL